MLRIAQASPPMEIAQATRKMSEGYRRVKPADLSSAAAHTVSKAPEKIKMNHAIAASWPSFRVAGYGSLVRGPHERQRACTQ
ncbi:hypothetical protein M7M4_02920 [Corynebacterium pseudogenitalium]